MSCVKRTGLFFFICAVSLTLAAGCSKAPDKHEKQVFAMDTVMFLTAYGDDAEAALDLADAEIVRLEKELDPEEPGSEVFNLNSSGSVAIESEAGMLLLKSIDVFKLSDGAFDPTIYPLYKAWGFLDQEYHKPTDAEIESLLPLVNLLSVSAQGETISMPSGTEITLGASAKGYAAQRVIEIMSENGVSSAIVSLGGDVMALGEKPDGSNWSVSITDPHNTGSSIGTLKIGGEAVFTSGGYERVFEVDGVSYHHIFDPRTGYPADSGLISVTVVCDDAVLADELSTALFVMGEDRAISYYRKSGGLELVLVTDDNRVLITEGLENRFTQTDADSDYDYSFVAFRN